MPSTWTQNFYHAVFSTKNRTALITPQIEPRLFPFIGGIVRDKGAVLVAIGGMPDHVHLLLRYPPNLAHSDLLRHVKGRSSKWVNETFPGGGGFSWQEGYGGFTVSKSSVSQVERYILNQKAHHETLDFKTEFLELLRKHGVEFDEGDVFL